MSGILQLINTFPSGGFAVKNSLRFRSSASAYLSKTFGSGNTTTWTWSCWYKRGALASSNVFISASNGGGSGGYWCQAILNSSDQLEFIVFSGGVGSISGRKITNAVYRDPSAWYNITFVFNTTASNAEDRMQIWVNGSRITSWATNTLISQNFSGYINDSSYTHEIGALYYSPNVNFLDGYMAEINFIDGQALTPSSFGAFDATSGVWQPVRYSGTYGTNGFYLKFSDTTSTTTLCYDYSGNGNNWTPNNISLTSGSTYDSMLDSPTNYDNGGTGVGNYCTLNPLYMISPSIFGAGYSTLSNANLTSTGDNTTSAGTFGVSSGKWYFEIVRTSGNAGDTNGVGFYLSGQNIEAIYRDNGQFRYAGTQTSYGASWDSNNITIGVALDLDSTSITFYKDGVSQGVAKNNLPAGVWIPFIYNRLTSTIQANFGQRPFAYTPPSGYKALNTQNLPAASIVNGASFMAATLYTGTGSAQTIINTNNGVSFQPDFVWQKCRSAAYNHGVNDSVRGAGNFLYPNTTWAEGSYPTDFSGFLSNGFSLGTGTGVVTNASGQTYVAWQWKAGGTAVTNTAGSITSQVSANTTAGFSVATFTAPSSGTSTVGHGLGIAPNMIIAKVRNVAGTGWAVYHSALPNASYYLQLNTTDAQASSAVVWNSTAPTSSVFSLGSAYSSSQQMVAYCFAAIAGYSAFGSYTGNGSSDGPFVFLGFRPRYVMIKRTDAAQNWSIVDTSRDTYNVANKRLFANLSDAEDTGIPNFLDILSNGFKCRDSNVSYNASGGAYIYAAFAENPLKYSLAR